VATKIMNVQVSLIIPYLFPAPGTISLGGKRVSCNFLLSLSTSDRGISTLKGTMSESAMFVDLFVPCQIELVIFVQSVYVRMKIRTNKNAANDAFIVVFGSKCYK
jgi:hypothetical protein